MSIPNIIAYLSIFVWLFPPLKQRGTKYFLFFALLAICDPLALVFYHIFQINSFQYYVVVGLLSVYLLTNKKTRYKLATLVLTFIYLFFGRHLNLEQVLILNTIFQTTILIIVVKELVVFMEIETAINVFLLLLISYQIITVYKMMVLVSFIEQNLIINNLSSFIQLFYGISFILVNVNTKSIRVKTSYFNNE